MKQRGFTIIEVTLFLALSGMLLLMAFIGTGAMAARQRLTDTTDSFQSFLQAQYDEVVNGVNLREPGNACLGPVTNPGASTVNGCLLLGRIIAIERDSSTVEAAYLVTNKVLSGSILPSDTDQKKLSNVDLTAATARYMETYKLKWDAEIAKVVRPQRGNGVGVEVNRIAFLRVPDSDRIVQVYYKDNTPFTATTQQPLRDALGLEVNYDNPANVQYLPGLKFCIKNGKDFVGQAVRSAVVIGDTGRSITTDYEPEGC